MVALATRNAVKPRERLLDAAYHLFARNGIGQVGIDTILQIGLRQGQPLQQFRLQG